ncbi:leucine zipper domain-containing protein, partial [Cupriavidus sp. 2MCAB6]|uniref:leucine zipper domain-containing protein n=1 Tax=Cupriavidus sp. 2MCAB6 TaxID=3232981 RepID=UPI003F92DF59
MKLNPPRTQKFRHSLMAAAGTASRVIARAAGVSLKTVHKWIARFAAEGMAGLADRSSRPRRLHRPTPAGQV